MAAVAIEPDPIATLLVPVALAPSPSAMAPVPFENELVPMEISLVSNVPAVPAWASVPIAMSSVPFAAAGFMLSPMAMDGAPLAAPPPTEVCATAAGAAAMPIAAKSAVTPPEPSEPRPRFLRFIPRARCAMRRTAKRRRRRDAPWAPLTQLWAKRSWVRSQPVLEMVI